MIYLNNAATSFPKPPCVAEAVQACLNGAPVSQFRAGTELRKDDSTTLCKKKIGELLGISQWDNIVFTSGATDSANRLICGLEYPNNIILTTQTEHNSILRPLMNQAHVKDMKLIILPCKSNGEVSLDTMKRKIEETIKTYGVHPDVLYINHCSNVTGQIQNLKEISELCHKFHIKIIADLSQSAGCIPIFVDEWELDGIIFTGHKSLFGMRGIGGYYLKKEISLTPFLYGGTGRNSEQLTYENKDFEYEVGTQNQPGIESLLAGVTYILNENIDKIVEKERFLMNFLYNELSKIPEVILYNTYTENHGPVMSMNIRGLAPSDVAYILQNVYDITVRTGLHCAPLIHKTMKTSNNGTVRISISHLTSYKEIRTFIYTISDLCESLRF